MRKLNVFVSATLFGTGQLLADRGWKIVEDMEKANIVLFTGGADIDPSLYGHEEHPATSHYPKRDAIEVDDYERALKLGLPMAGICRGAQLLNVMGGGKMYQHVNGHARGGTHRVVDLWTQEVWNTTSAHHQMMIPNNDALIIAVSDPSLCTVKERMEGSKVVNDADKNIPDVEVIFIPKIKALCYQGHPEYSGSKRGTELFFDYIDSYIFNE